MLPPGSPEPGKWRSARVPFWDPIYEAAQHSRPRTIVVVTASQMAKTEAMFNIIGHRSTDGPYMPMLYVGPTEKNVRSISRDRIDKMLRSTPVLWDRLEKGQRNSVYEKFIAGMRLGFAWAGSATELASHPVGLVFVDERDRMEGDVKGEGDPVELAGARTKNYPLGKVFVFSTPTVEGGSAVWTLLDQGTLQFWCWPCPACNGYFAPRLNMLRWFGATAIADVEQAARVVCPRCEHAIEDKWREPMNAAGGYRPHVKDDTERDGYRMIEQPIDSPIWSYWVHGLCSPWVTFPTLAAKLFSAYKGRDQEAIKTVLNTWGGELYKVKGTAPEWAEVASRRCELRENIAPRDVQMITMGADVQKFGIYYVIRGWGFGMESWLITHGYLQGETEFDAVWIALSRVMQTPISERYVNRCFADSGYRPGDVARRPDHAVYSWARRHPGVAYPTKGWDTRPMPVSFAAIDVTGSDGAFIKSGVRLAHLDTDFFKRWIHGRVHWPEDQPGQWWLHAGTTEEYCKHIVAEQQLTLPSGRTRWARKDANHYLDAEMNATAAAWSLNVFALPPLPDDPPVPSSRQTDRAGSADRGRDGYRRQDL